MTLADAFTSYTRSLHQRTLRPFLRFAVVNAANSNSAPPSPRAGASALLSGRPTLSSVHLLHVDGVTS